MTTQEKLDSLVFKVKQMREAQKKYFKTRVQQVLAQSKMYEKDVDDLIESFTKPNLFS